MRNTVADLICKKAKSDKNLFLISGDAGLGVWDTFSVEHKEQFLNPGVNEACDVGMAAGLALMGHKVIYYNIAPFVIMRPYEQVRNDICYQKLPVILVGTGSGITYAPAGMTHYAVEDIALARTMPNLNIFSPCDPIEAKAAFEYAYASDKPSYIRIPKNGEPNVREDRNISITESALISGGDDGLIIFHGSIVDEVVECISVLKERGINVSAVSKPMVNAMDETCKDLINKHENIFVAEEHFETGGLGSLISDYSIAQDKPKAVTKIAIRDEYIHKVGNRDYLRKYYGIDAKGMSEKVLSKIEK